MQRSPDQERRAIGEQRSNEPKPVAPRPKVGGAQPNCGSSRSIPHDDRSSGRDSVHGLVAARLARSHASKCARLAALCGWKGAAVVRDRTGSRRRRWWNRDHQDRGSSCRRARCLFDHRTWRAAEERSVRNHRLQPPTLRVGSGWNSVNTKCVRDCVRRFWSSARCSSGNRHRTPTRPGQLLPSTRCSLRRGHPTGSVAMPGRTPVSPHVKFDQVSLSWGTELWVAGRSHGQRT